MEYTNITKALFNQAKNLPLKEEIIYETFLKHAFPVYDIGKILKKYLKNANIDINNENAIRQFARDSRFSPIRLIRALKNEAVITRNEAIQLCFCFQLDLPKANEFLKEMRHCSFHYRSFDDLIYAFYITKKGSFAEAQDLITEYQDSYNEKPLNKHKKEKESYANYGKQNTPELITSSYSAYFAQKLSEPNFELENLKNILEEEGLNILSELNLTATQRYQALFSELYKEFNPYEILDFDELETAELKELNLDKFDGCFSICDVCHIISADTRTSNIDISFQGLLNRVSSFLPDDAALSKLLNYRAKVTRNNFLILLLCYMEACKYPTWMSDWENETSTNQTMNKFTYCFYNAIEFINKELELCCFPPLHPRVPLDYLILSSLALEEPHQTFTEVWKSTIENSINK